MSAKFFLNGAGSEDKSILETKGKDLQPSHEANNTENIIAILLFIYLSTKMVIHVHLYANLN